MNKASRAIVACYYTASELRRIIQENETYLKTDDDRNEVLRMAFSIANRFDDKLVINTAGWIPTLKSGWDRDSIEEILGDRDQRFDDGITLFIKTCYECVDLREKLELDRRKNANIPGRACREKVLLALSDVDGATTTDALAKVMALTRRQVSNAIEELLLDMAIEAKHVESPSDDGREWKSIKLLARGRLMMEADPNCEKPTATNNYYGPVHTYGDNAVVGNSGYARDVSVNKLPSLPVDVRDAASKTEAGRECVDDLERSTLSQNTDRNFLKQRAGQVKALIEAANVTTEVVTHAHEWFNAFVVALAKLSS